MWPLVLIIPVTAVAFLLALTSYSQFDLRPSDTAAVLFAYDPANINHQVILSLRLPRALVAVFVGMALSVAGLIMQGMTRNPLASPSVFGVSAGAAMTFAMAATGLVPWFGHLPIVLITFGGAALAGTLVFFLGGLHRAPIHPIRVVLAGVALNFLFLSLTQAVVILADENAYGVFHWLTGSIGNATYKDVKTVAPWALLGVGGAFWLSHPLNLLRLGEERMQNLGGGLGLVRWFGSLTVILLIAAAVSVAGPIGFVGLIVPHICRFLIGQDYRLLVPMCALTGATLLLLADILARGLRFPNDSPVGILTTLIGAGFFLMMARRKLEGAE